MLRHIFWRLTSGRATEAELLLRTRQLSLTIDLVTDDLVTVDERDVIGVGHSKGAATLLAMAGAQMWLGLLFTA